MRTHIDGDFRHAAAKDNTRYAMAAVEVRKAATDGRVMISATDGRVLAARIQDGEGPEEPLLVPTELLKTKAGGEVTRTADGELQVKKPRSSTTEFANPLTGSFPAIADAIPEVSGMADLKSAANGVYLALRLTDKLKADQENGSPSGDTLDALAAALESAQTELEKSHHRVVGLSAKLLMNLSRALNAGEQDADSLGVMLILPPNPARPICALPVKGDGSTLGVIMPLAVDDGVASQWERIRGEMLDALEPERVVRRDEAATAAAMAESGPE